MLLSRLHEYHVDSLMHDQESHLNPWFKVHACYGTGGGATFFKEYLNTNMRPANDR
ncbi:MAG: hypothetical protein BMS9Abin25_1491 [Gammaproteobacteria bacterium]|nr:MAG: hypothetical protein BMS9Abin25_1491 [Gammaproteobacteria bacterium]